MAFLCDLPWVHFSIFPHGTTSVCCETEHRGAMGHGYNIDENGQKNILGIKDNSIDDIVNSDNYKRDFIYVGDCCNIHRYMLTTTETGIFNIGTGVATSFQTIGELVAKRFKLLFAR